MELETGVLVAATIVEQTSLVYALLWRGKIAVDWRFPGAFRENEICHRKNTSFAFSPRNYNLFFHTGRSKPTQLSSYECPCTFRTTPQMELRAAQHRNTNGLEVNTVKRWRRNDFSPTNAPVVNNIFFGCDVSTVKNYGFALSHMTVTVGFFQ